MFGSKDSLNKNVFQIANSDAAPNSQHSDIKPISTGLFSNNSPFILASANPLPDIAKAKYESKVDKK